MNDQNLTKLEAASSDPDKGFGIYKAIALTILTIAGSFFGFLLVVGAILASGLGDGPENKDPVYATVLFVVLIMGFLTHYTSKTLHKEVLSKEPFSKERHKFLYSHFGTAATVLGLLICAILPIIIFILVVRGQVAKNTKAELNNQKIQMAGRLSGEPSAEEVFDTGKDIGLGSFQRTNSPLKDSGNIYKTYSAMPATLEQFSVLKDIYIVVKTTASLTPEEANKLNAYYSWAETEQSQTMISGQKVNIFQNQLFGSEDIAWTSGDHYVIIKGASKALEDPQAYVHNKSLLNDWADTIDALLKKYPSDIK